MSHSLALIGLGEYLRLCKMWLLVSFVFVFFVRVMQEDGEQFFLTFHAIDDLYLNWCQLLIN